jgi:hypothetical protein
MCWNADISLNTFIFGVISLIFIYITNTYTKYKTPMFDSPLVYLLLFSVVSMQLVEYFLWKNLKTMPYNIYYSSIGFFLVMLQLFLMIIIIKDSNIRNVLVGIYLIFSLYIISQHSLQKDLYTTVGKNGHLVWEWMNFKNTIFNNTYIYFFIYFVALFFMDNLMLKPFIVFSLLFSVFFYYKDRTFGSMWCWIFNLFFLYFIVNILLIQPFYEYNGLC